MKDTHQTQRITEAQAPESLNTCAGLLQLAHASARTARGGLGGARATRCDELLNILADGINYSTRLGMVVLGDVRAAQGVGRIRPMTSFIGIALVVAVVLELIGATAAIMRGGDR